MLKRLILSVVVGVIVFLLVLLASVLLISLKVDFAVAIGEFLENYAGVFGLLAAIWFFFTGRTTPSI